MQMKKNKWCLSFLLSMLVSVNAWALAVPSLVLIDFTVIQSGNKIDIKWKTSIETGGPYFTIEKSKNGKEYTKIIDLPETQDGTVYSDYFETDYQPYTGVSYYRIKQTDETGNFRYSQTIVLKMEGDKTPLVSAINLSLENETLIVLRDANGNDFYSKAIITSENNKLYTTSLSSVPAGEYRIVGSSNEEIQSNTLIVK